MTLAAHEGKLRVRAPEGVLTPELKAALSENKSALLRLLEGAGAAGGAAASSPIPRADRSAPLPLSFSQQRLWFLDRLDPDSRAYAMVLAYELEGAVDRPALEAALGDLAARHESLRTTFGEREGVPCQMIAPPGPVELSVESLADVAAEGRLEQARRRATALRELPFDLATGPLLRARLFTLSDDRAVLALALHHIVYDGWSLGVLLAELSALYAARHRGETPQLAAPTVQYADYAAWERDRLDSGPELERLLAHWRQRLAGLDPLVLPTDRPRPAVQRGRGARQSLALTPELVRSLEQRSREQGATLFMTLLATFAVLLRRYSGQDDVVVGSPVANRGHSALERMVGPFVNMIALRTDLSGAPTFRELLDRVRATVVDGLAHQELPFEKLVEDLQPERDRSRNPIFQVSFALHGSDLEPPALDELVVRPLGVERTTTVFDIAVDVMPEGDGMNARITYDTDLFDAGTVTHMGEAWSVLLEAVAADPDRPVDQLPLMRPDDRERWLRGLDVTAAEYPRERGLQELVQARAARTPEAPAVQFGEQQWSYADLETRANRLANVLREAGVRRGVLVGLCLERSPDMLAGMLAVLRAGGAYVPLDPGFPASRLAFMLEDSGAPVLLTSEGLLTDVEPLPATVIRVDADAAAIAAAPATAPEDGGGPDDLAYVIYTSGSTGRPKGVQVHHRAVVNFLTSMAREPGLGPGDVLTAVTTISFDIAGLELFLPLVTGARIVLASREEASDGQRLARLMADSGTTVLQATPATWQMLLQSGWSDPNLKMICGGEALPRPLAQALLASGGELWNVYGPTETTIWSSVGRVRSGAGPVPIGRPLANTRLLVLDARREPVPPGVPGELYIGGDGVAKGYLERPELTAERFVPDPFHPGERLYRTGDRVRERADGELEFLGRMDTQVKLRGFRIELGEIEAVLGGHPDVREAVVLLREDRPGDPRLVGYVTPAAPFGAAGIDALRRWLGGRLPDYMVPSAFVALDELPRTPNRKIDRKALPAPSGERQSSRELVPPRTPVETVLASIWTELLGLDAIGVHDDVFELGGHSLLVTRFVSRLRDRLGLEMPLGRVFETPTIEGQAGWVEEQGGAEGGAPQAGPELAPAPRGEDMPLSFAQQRLWFLDQMGTGAAYNMPVAIALEGRLDPDALAAALAAIVQRHETLRTHFRVVDGRPRQIIAPSLELPLELEDRSGAASDRDAEVRRLAAEESDRPFDLETGPLVRARLLRLGPDDHVLLLTLHHIISDGWSLGILAQELVEHYGAARGGGRADVPELPVQYADFAAWQRQALEGEGLRRHLDYWTGQLAELTPLELPTDRPRPAMQTFRGASRSFRLPPELAEGLEALARQQGVTLAMLMLGAWGALLSRCSGQEDIAVGSPIANRTRSALEPLIGFFANSLVLRMDTGGDPTFRQLVDRVQAMSLAAYEHQDLPFERLVDELQPERSLSQNPLFQVVFAMQDVGARRHELDELSMTLLPPVVTRTRTDLELHLGRGPDGIGGILVYSTDLFDETTVARLARYYETLLAGAVADPGCRLSRLPLLGDDERRRMLQGWNDTAMAYPDRVCVHELIEQRVAETPDAVALIHGEQQVSYGELNTRANRLAHVLRAQGVGPDRLVGLCVERGPDMIVGLLGILKAGGAYVPMDPGYPPERLAFMVEDSGAPVIVTNEPLLGVLPDPLPPDVSVVCLDRDAAMLAAASDRNPDPRATPDDLAYAIYTSGSTGTPKCALLRHRGLCSLSESQRRMFGVERDSRVLQFSSFSFDAATFEIVMALPKGATLVLGSREELLPGPDLLSFLQRHRINIVTLIPTALAAVPDAALPDLRTITVAGEACPAELVSRWAPGRRFFNLYGPTETTIWATATELKAGGEVHIGRPIGNTQAYILDARGQPVPVGVPGELHIGGVGLARGYHRRPELTAERFISHPFSDDPQARLYRTGDRARFRPDGTIEFLGRIDHQVKLRGHRIELGEIEAALDEHPAVRESLAMIREDSPGHRRIVAYVVDDAEVELPPEGDGADQDHEDWAADHVSHWQTLYDDTYAEAAKAADGTFNVSGWNSSYTDEPIDPEQMREWVEATVAQISELGPKRVLEMGCGSGLLLFRLARGCERYVGTDFSSAAVAAVGAHLPALGDAAERVELHQRTAHELAGIPDGSVDTVVLNSVSQYFPGADYLVQVIDEGLRVLGEQGRMFIGDVRSLPLLSAFHTSVQLHRAADDADLGALRRQVHALANLDQELVVDPAFFLALVEHRPELSRVEIRPKPGRYDNELSRFRYDVVLHVGDGDESDGAGGADEGAWTDWGDADLDLAALRSRLEQQAPEVLCLAAVPNARTAADVTAAALMERGAEARTAGDLRQAVAARVEEAGAVHPQDLADLAEELGYEAHTSWAAARPDGSFDLALRRRGSRAPLPAFPRATRPHVSWTAYTNNPLRGRRLRELVPRLRRHLADRMPEYMVPAAVVALEAFPVTPNGKIDRKALPAPDALRPELAGDYVAPQSALEDTLARIWADVLDLQRVGVNDNFFELGGDSILSIQVVAAARKAGIGFRARDLFEHQTVAELAGAATTDATSDAEQGVVTGAVPLTPIQHWLLEQDLADLHHFNQALHLSLREPVGEDVVRAALVTVVRHHDALRLELSADDGAPGGWSQHLGPPGADVPLSVVDLSGLSASDEQAAMLREAGRVQASLDPGRGVLLAATLFTRGASPPSLLLVAHHWAVDAVSWPVLMEDLGAALQAGLDGETPRLPPKTTSFRAWAEGLQTLAAKPRVAEQAQAWLDRPWSLAADLPCDAPVGAAADATDTVGALRTVATQLDAETTRALLQEVPTASHARIDEALVTALGRALSRWTGAERLLLDLEGHGREDVVPGADLSRTVGWFTSIYPVLLDVDRQGDPGVALRATKEQLRTLPERGLVFGLARYLSDDATLRSRLAAIPTPRVAFNYLGHFGSRADRSRGAETPMLAFSGLPAGPMRSPRQRRRHWVEINVRVSDGVLHAVFGYSEARHREETMRGLADDFMGELRELVQHCRSSEAGQLTASDVSDFGWSQDDLDDILTDLD